ncbi:hypothetical protein LY78DRAFT_660393 [Colletotrichum sublineola]|nr:hypothetical protein LY78DRAFT_660393 [Colletotrichum sublineola]
MPTRRFICWPLYQNLPLTYITNLALDPCFCRHTIPPSAAKGKVDNEFAERIRYCYIEGVVAVVTCMPSLEADRFGGRGSTRQTWVRKLTQLHSARLHTVHRPTTATPIHIGRYHDEN